MNAQTGVERAAGGVVIRVRNGVREVLLIDDAYGHVTFPKGHLEAFESWETAAVREVEEETGIRARIVMPLSRLEYQILRDDKPVRKQVRLFLMEEIDESKNPTALLEELKAAYFVPLADAIQLHEEKGYANWSFVLPKAEILDDWNRQGLEQKFRLLGAEEDEKTLEAAFASAEPLLERLIAVIRAELSVLAPEWVPQLPERALTFRRRENVSTADLLSAIEHTLLKPEAGVVAIENLCDEARTHQFRAVCVNPQHIDLVASRLRGSDVIPCVVVGFPLGATDVAALRAEAQAVVDAGAREVDMVIPVGSMVEDDIFAVYQRVRAVVSVAQENVDVAVKVILEAHFLTVAQLAMASCVALAAGADFIKTSTGFAASGAKITDVALMAMIAGTRGVKAAGGVRSRTAAVNFLRYGATRLGTSSGVKLVE